MSFIKTICKRTLNSISFPILILLVSCSNKQELSSEFPKYEFNSLKLTQNTPSGNKYWDFESYDTSYDVTTKLIRAKSPYVNIYSSDNNIDYKLSAALSTILNDGDLFLLEGNVIFASTTNNPLKISSDFLRWNTNESIFYFDKNPKVTSQDNIIKTNNAKYIVKDNILNLYGNTTVDSGDDNNQNSYTFNFLNGTLNSKTGKVTSSGSVSGRNYFSKDKYIELEADSINANFLKGDLGFDKCFISYELVFTTHSEYCSLITSKYFELLYINSFKDNRPNHGISLDDIFQPNQSFDRKKVFVSSKDKSVKTTIDLNNFNLMND